MTIQADDQRMNKTNHENFANGRLPREWLRGAEVEEANTIYDGKAILPPEANMIRYLENDGKAIIETDNIFLRQHIFNYISSPTSFNKSDFE